jgi:hypothetical protein
MVNWKAILQESPIDYLLEEDNPSVRYFTLRDILGKEDRDSEVTAAKHAIADSPIVKKIFQKQMPNGYWNNPAKRARYVRKNPNENTQEKHKKGGILQMTFHRFSGCLNDTCFDSSPPQSEFFNVRARA